MVGIWWVPLLVCMPLLLVAVLLLLLFLRRSSANISFLCHGHPAGIMFKVLSLGSVMRRVKGPYRAAMAAGGRK
jgi:hypothetical protein